MPASRYFYPEILSSEDIQLLHEAVRDLVDAGHREQHERDAEHVARIVLRLYRNGLTDPGKLMELAAMMADRETGFPLSA